MEFIKYIFSDFWIFLGFMMMIAIVLNFILMVYRSTLRHLNIRKQGWPPAHLDADGDFKSEKKDEKEKENTN